MIMIATNQAEERVKQVVQTVLESGKQFNGGLLEIYKDLNSTQHCALSDQIRKYAETLGYTIQTEDVRLRTEAESRYHDEYQKLFGLLTGLLCEQDEQPGQASPENRAETLLHRIGDFWSRELTTRLNVVQRR